MSDLQTVSPVREFTNADPDPHVDARYPTLLGWCVRCDGRTPAWAYYATLDGAHVLARAVHPGLKSSSFGDAGYWRGYVSRKTRNTLKLTQAGIDL